MAAQLICIDCPSSRMVRYEGHKRTHKEFGVNAPLDGSADVLLFLEIVRTDPDSQNIEREPVDVH